MDRAHLGLDGPGQVDGGRAGGQQQVAAFLQMRLEAGRPRGLECGELHAVAGGRADEPGAAHVHVANGVGHGLDIADVLDDEMVRKVALVDDPHRPVVAGILPDCAVMPSLDLHRAT